MFLTFTTEDQSSLEAALMNLGYSSVLDEKGMRKKGTLRPIVKFQKFKPELWSAFQKWLVENDCVIENFEKIEQLEFDLNEMKVSDLIFILKIFELFKLSSVSFHLSSDFKGADVLEKFVSQCKVKLNLFYTVPFKLLPETEKMFEILLKNRGFSKIIFNEGHTIKNIKNWLDCSKREGSDLSRTTVEIFGVNTGSMPNTPREPNTINDEEEINCKSLNALFTDEVKQKLGRLQWHEKNKTTLLRSPSPVLFKRPGSFNFSWDRYFEGGFNFIVEQKKGTNTKTIEEFNLSFFLISGAAASSTSAAPTTSTPTVPQARSNVTV
ncbi:MAG: hypothetical protein ACKOAD_06390 [Gammaproteobacteria bacterium]